MTVGYTLDVSRNSWANAFKILFRWEGSIWRLIWKELLLWLFGYYAIMVLYRSEWILNPDGQRTFEKLAHHIKTRIDWIPLTFILAFFVNMVVNRWSRIIDNMGYIENAAVTVAMTVSGSDHQTVLARRAMVRWLCLSQVLVFRDISLRVRRRFPNLESIVQAGFLEEEEKNIYENLTIDSNKYWLPINWACSQAFQLRESTHVKSEPALMQLLVEIKNFRTSLQTLCNFDWVPVPLAYPQVVFFAVRVYFILALVARQYIIGTEAENKSIVDIAFPLMTVLQFVFYVGWMKVAESLLNPMGEDHDHFESNSLIDKNIAIALAIVDDTHGQLPKLVEDKFRTQDGPLYAENAVPRGHHSAQFAGSAAHLVLAAKDEPVTMVAVKTEPVIEEVVDPTSSSFIPNSVRKRIRRYSQRSISGNLGKNRSNSLATIEIASQKNSVPSKDRRFANTINGRLPHDTDFGNSLDSINSPFSTSSGFNYSNPPTQGMHHHVKRPTTLDEIIEEEISGSLSRGPSARNSGLGDSQSSEQSHPINLGGTQISPILEDTVAEDRESVPRSPSATFTLSSPPSSTTVVNYDSDAEKDTVISLADVTFTISPPMSPQSPDETNPRRSTSLPSGPSSNETDRPSDV